MESTNIMLKTGKVINGTLAIVNEPYDSNTDYDKEDIYSVTININNGENSATIRIHNGIKMRIDEALKNVQGKIKKAEKSERQALEDLINLLNKYLKEGATEIVVYPSCRMKCMTTCREQDRVATKSAILSTIKAVNERVSSNSVLKR